jgi:hypothetical protein
LDAVIDRTSRVVDDVATSTRERRRQVMLQRGPFVALIDVDGRFVAVVERIPLVDDALTRLLESEAETSNS